MVYLLFFQYSPNVLFVVFVFLLTKDLCIILGPYHDACIIGGQCGEFSLKLVVLA